MGGEQEVLLSLKPSNITPSINRWSELRLRESIWAASEAVNDYIVLTKNFLHVHRGAILGDCL